MDNLVKLIIGVFISVLLRLNSSYAIVVIGGMFNIQIPITYAIVGIFAFSIASIRHDDGESDTSMDKLIKESLFCLVMPWMISITALIISLFI